MRLFPASAIVALSIASAQASAKPVFETEKVTAAIRAAEELGAAGDPEAALHLQLAQEELAEATALAEEGKVRRAQSYLMRAEIDANKAIVLSHEDARKREAEAAVERVQKLQSDNK